MILKVKVQVFRVILSNHYFGCIIAQYCWCNCYTDYPNQSIVLILDSECLRIECATLQQNFTFHSATTVHAVTTCDCLYR